MGTASAALIGAMEPRDTTDAFEVTSPTFGYTFGLHDDDARILVGWTVPPAIADKPVLIQLVQGVSERSLSYIDVVNGKENCAKLRARKSR